MRPRGTALRTTNALATDHLLDLGVSSIAARNWFHRGDGSWRRSTRLVEEMIATLRSKWQRGLAFEELIRLRDELDEMLQQIRAERQIRPPVVKCPKCGHIGEGAAPHVSVRAMILSVIRFDIDDGNATRAVEKQWKAYLKENRLDLNGKVAVHGTERPSPAPSHSH